MQINEIEPVWPKQLLKQRKCSFGANIVKKRNYCFPRWVAATMFSLSGEGHDGRRKSLNTPKKPIPQKERYELKNKLETIVPDTALIGGTWTVGSCYAHNKQHKNAHCEKQGLIFT